MSGSNPLFIFPQNPFLSIIVLAAEVVPNLWTG